MARATSRRNGHGAGASPKAALFAAASLCVLVFGAGSAAWACGLARDAQLQQDAAAAQEQQAARAQEQGAGQPEGAKSDVRGIIENSERDNEQAAAAPDNATKETGSAPKRKTTKRKAAKKTVRKKTAPARTKTIHHTAYKRKAVYRTERHRAAVARKIADAEEGGYHVEWTLCPTCGKRHASSYEQKVVVRYKETLCKACGGKHKHAYDETVTY